MPALRTCGLPSCCAQSGKNTSNTRDTHCAMGAQVAVSTGSGKTTFLRHVALARVKEAESTQAGDFPDQGACLWHRLFRSDAGESKEALRPKRLEQCHALAGECCSIHSAGDGRWCALQSVLLGHAQFPFAALAQAWKYLRPGKRFVIMDGKLATGIWGRLSRPFVTWLSQRTILGDPMKSPQQDLRELTDTFGIEEFNLGTYYICTARKPT